MPTATLTPTAQFDQRALEDLEREIGLALLLDAEIWKHYEKANLQPTQRACTLAARAALMVLVAHNIGQEVGQ